LNLVIRIKKFFVWKLERKEEKERGKERKERKERKEKKKEKKKKKKEKIQAQSFAPGALSLNPSLQTHDLSEHLQTPPDVHFVHVDWPSFDYWILICFCFLDSISQKKRKEKVQSQVEDWVTPGAELHLQVPVP